MPGFVGVTSSKTSSASVTVSPVFPEMLPRLAVIIVVPTATELADPLLPPALLIVAVSGLLELQVTTVVRSCVVLFENVPVAVNC